MGCGTSAANYAAGANFKMIPDSYKSYEEVTAALRKAGLEKSQLMVGVDFTKSNLWNGKRSFDGRSLHDVTDTSRCNPYLQALSIISKALWDFDDDHMIPAYGFGDAQTGSKGVFSFQENDLPCKGLTGVEQRYREIATAVTLSGPTSFAPLIYQAIKTVCETNEYHILLILADGQVSKEEIAATTKAIVEASNYALSIVMIGIGDGPWDLMEKFDDELPQRRFDNFQFVEFQSVFQKYPLERREAAFATHALMEVPMQYQSIKRLRLLSQGSSSGVSGALRSLPAALPPPTNCTYQEMSSALPGDWICAWSFEDRRYYYCSWELRETSWKKPTVLQARRKSASEESDKSSASTASTVDTAGTANTAQRTQPASYDQTACRRSKLDARGYYEQLYK